MDLLYGVIILDSRLFRFVTMHAFDRQRRDRQKGDSKSVRCIGSRTVKSEWRHYNIRH